MSDSARDDFSALDAFDHDPSPDADTMDRMLLNLATPADPPDWTNYSNLDALPSDLYPNSSTYPPLSYIESPLPEPDAVHAALDTRTPPSPPFPPPPPVTTATTTTTTTTTSTTTTATTPKKRTISKSPPKPRVPTAVCKLCGKAISTNGANFKRHQDACRRQRPTPLNSHSLRTPQSPSEPRLQPQQPSHHLSISQQRPSSAPASNAPPLSRRDSDLLAIVRRSEASIATLDVNARLCLRDALLSLSNKASNPHMPPTPEQEAMNRAAEYLVLRMLFLSGQQVMHTPPGTASVPYTPEGVPDRDTTHPHVVPQDNGPVVVSTIAPGSAVKEPDTFAVKTEDKLGDDS